MISCYEVYVNRKNNNEICCYVSFGDLVNGHPNIVHGGITALVLDNTFGWLFVASKLPLAVTANININYRAPIYANTSILIKAKIDGIENRKIKMSANIFDEKGTLLVEATSLFVTIKMPWYLKSALQVVTYLGAWMPGGGWLVGALVRRIGDVKN